MSFAPTLTPSQHTLTLPHPHHTHTHTHTPSHSHTLTPSPHTHTHTHTPSAVAGVLAAVVLKRLQASPGASGHPLPCHPAFEPRPLAADLWTLVLAGWLAVAAAGLEGPAASEEGLRSDHHTAAVTAVAAVAAAAELTVHSFHHPVK